MMKYALIATATIAIGCLLSGCSKEPDPNETGNVVKGLPPGGAPPDAKRPKGPFDDAPPGAPGAPGAGRSPLSKGQPPTGK